MTNPYTARMFDSVLEFMKAGDQEHYTEPQVPSLTTQALRMNLLQEEVEEYIIAAIDNINSNTDPTIEQLAEIADALADIVYVCIGTMYAYGFNPAGLMREVCESNLTKIGADGKVLKNSSGKILKPEGFQKPDFITAMFPDEQSE